MTDAEIEAEVNKRLAAESGGVADAAPAASAPAASAPAATVTPNPYAALDDAEARIKAEKKGLSPEQIAMLVGGVGGGLFGKPPVLQSTGAAAQFAEQLHGAPVGSLNTVRELANPESPRAVARRAAGAYAPSAPTAVAAPELTPGEKWAAKTGYGAGPGTVQESSSAYQRRLGKGKITSRLDKLYGPATPGESAQLAQRMLERSASSEAAVAQRLLAETAQAEAARVAEAARESTLTRMAKNIERAGGTSAMLQRGLRTGFNVGTGVLGGLHGYQGIADIQKQGANVGNVGQTVEGAGLLAAMRNPSVGLPVAGGAAMTQAGKSMYDTGVTPENTAKMIGGAGLAVMPRHPVIGGAMQTPQMVLAIREWLKANPEKAAQLNQPIMAPFGSGPSGFR
jgi:hypothetical protein